MKKLLLSWAAAYVVRYHLDNPKGIVETDYDGKHYLLDVLVQPRLQDEFEATESVGGLIKTEPEPERAGRVLETSPAIPSWKPDQHGHGVIVAEPTAVANERKLKERK